MTLLNASYISKSFADFVLFSNLSLTINSNEKIALVGVNGCGKSTLLKILCGQIEASNLDGKTAAIAFGKGVKIGYLSQQVISSADNTLIEEMRIVFENEIHLVDEFERLNKVISVGKLDEKTSQKYDELLNKIDDLGAFEYSYQIDSILSKFGFSKDDYNRKITSFSGGERSKIGFARLLLQKPELLILDEPTNHLDISTIEWLTKYLKNYNGSILFVSHDRYFIDDISTKIIELENGNLTTYNTNYEGYVEEKKKNGELLLKQYKLQKKEIEKLEWFIKFYKVKPRFVSRAKDREKKLARITRISLPKEESNKLKLQLVTKDEIRGKIIAEFDQIEIGYEQTLVDPFSFLLFSNDKIAIMGDNGVGKSTFIKNILGLIPLKGGHVVFKRKISVGYLAQNDFDKSNVSTLISTISNLVPYMKNTQVRSHLAKFGFYGDDVYKTLSSLSGGEQMRFNLAKIVLENHDLLLLDEPTNNLDLLTKDALIDAINDFKGAVIIVSHDRFVVNRICNKILYIKDKNATMVEGNYEDLKEALIDEPVFIETKKEVIKKDNSKSNKKRINEINNKLVELEKALEINKQNQHLEENYLDYIKFNDLTKEETIIEEELLRLMLELETLLEE